MTSVLCWGELVWDRFGEIRRLGGAPANVAYHLVQLGLDAAIVSRVGDDEPGARATRELAAAGVRTDLLQRDDVRPTGHVDVRVVDGEPSYTICSGVAWEAIAYTEAVRSALAQASALYLGTLAQRAAATRASLIHALEDRPATCRVVVDVNLRGPVEPALLRTLLEAAHVVKVGVVELAEVARLLAIPDPVAWLLQRDASLVAVTRGAAGSQVFGRGWRLDRPAAPATTGGDAVGAGDAFTAVMIAGMLRDAPPPAVHAAASRYAAWIASHIGAMVPAAMSLEALLAEQRSG